MDEPFRPLLGESSPIPEGFRALPYPFDSALAINSDTDRSSVTNCRKYWKILVDDNGLDFGDSCWLHTNFGRFPGQGFFDRNFTFSQGRSKIRPESFDTFEMVALHHFGMFDIWHSFLARGPRFVVVQFQAIRENFLECILPTIPEKPHTYFNVGGFYAIGLLLYLKKDATIPTVRVEGRQSNSYFDRIEGFEIEVDDVSREGVPVLFTFPLNPDIDTEPNEITKLGSIQIEGCANGDILGAYLLNSHSPMLENRLSYLKDYCGVNMEVLTVHSAWHIYSNTQQETLTRKALDRIRERLPILESFFGSYRFNGTQHISTLIDEGTSFARMFPFLIDKYGLRFIRPTENFYDDENHPEVTGAIGETKTRNGFSLGFVCSTNSRNREGFQSENPAMTIKSIAGNFQERLAQILIDFEERSGRVVFLTTHLGNIEPHLEATEPYFEGESIEELSSRYFGFDDSCCRVWFARSSVLSNYCAILGTLRLSQIFIEEENRLVLDIEQSECESFREVSSRFNLFGITILTKSIPERIDVTFKGELIYDFAVSESSIGEGCVTILETGIKYPLMAWKKPKVVEGQCLRTYDSNLSTYSDFFVGRVTKGEDFVIEIEESFPYLSSSSVISFWCRCLRPDDILTLSIKNEAGFETLVDCGIGMAGSNNQRDSDVHCEVPLVNGTKGEWRRVCVPVWNMKCKVPGAKFKAMPISRPSVVSFSTNSSESIEVAHLEFGKPKNVSGENIENGELHCFLGVRASKHDSVFLRRVRKGQWEELGEGRVIKGGFASFGNLNPGLYSVRPAEGEWSDSFNMSSSRWDIDLE